MHRWRVAMEPQLAARLVEKVPGKGRSRADHGLRGAVGPGVERLGSGDQPHRRGGGTVRGDRDRRVDGNEGHARLLDGIGEGDAEGGGAIRVIHQTHGPGVRPRPGENPGAEADGHPAVGGIGERGDGRAGGFSELEPAGAHS